MTDQPTKTKQQLLAELESIMSMLDDDAVIPTLDTVVEPSAGKEPSANGQEPSAGKQPSADGQEPSAGGQKPSADKEPSAVEETLSEEITTPASISEQPIDETQAAQTTAEALEDRQQLTSELDDELRQAMEIDIKIPEVKVPNSQTLFGIEGSDTSSSDNDIEATLEPEKAAYIDTKNSELENTDLETKYEEEVQPYSNPKEDSAEPFAVEESHDIYTPEEGLISDKLIAAANAQLQSQKDSDTTLPQQNPFPAPNRKLHLLNGETQAEAPLPGQQHLFDLDSENKTNSDQATTHQVTAHQVTTEKESTETVTEEPLAKPQNPFKNSNTGGSAYPPASLLNSMRRPKPQQAIEPGNPVNEEAKLATRSKVSPFEQQESLSLSQADEPETIVTGQISSPDDKESNSQEAVEAIDIDAMVDKLIQEQLPKLEAELRKRLTQALSAELEL
ncbi:hypothetical protein [uncultured Pseudoteredinibacter sp.]|uniref:hypothetical protein n=1 Tax=uncultured Pseudoteredinibacter sp. TaxID=1641701 RepID=UPI00260DAB6D|nr:hypothetical protein [uncultured Pseudoteredinibacter sp.]